jgi:hypothetical protein
MVDVPYNAPGVADNIELVGEAHRTVSLKRLTELARHKDPLVVASAMRNTACPCPAELHEEVVSRAEKNPPALAKALPVIAGISRSRPLLRRIFTLLEKCENSWAIIAALQTNKNLPEDHRVALGVQKIEPKLRAAS